MLEDRLFRNNKKRSTRVDSYPLTAISYDRLLNATLQNAGKNQENYPKFCGKLELAYIALQQLLYCSVHVPKFP